MKNSLRIVKIGGKIAENPSTLSRFLDDFIAFDTPQILVHGGGVIASEMGKRLGIKPNMIDGRRVTDAQTLEVVTMVYGGLINKRLVAHLQSRGVHALGLTGADGNAIQAKKRPQEPIDFGWVGDIESVNTDLFSSLIDQGILPVLAPLTHDGKGNMLNTNADAIASYVAAAMATHYEIELIFGFDREGVMDSNGVVAALSMEGYQKLKSSGIISDGMIPKLDLGFQALTSGVQSVRIKSATDLMNRNAGTELKHV
ncbi:MAG: acetylglutamate kinase [Bacteroidota bacterium]